jgi:hypothetical protein
MQHGMQALAHVLPNAELRVLEGQNHMLKPKVTAPVVWEFFLSGVTHGLLSPSMHARCPAASPIATLRVNP